MAAQSQWKRALLASLFLSVRLGLSRAIVFFGQIRFGLIAPTRETGLGVRLSLTIAKIPALIASGSSGHASMKTAKSGQLGRLEVPNSGLRASPRTSS
jgi:hypothetical protein